MTKYAFLAVTMAALSVAAAGGCLCIDQCLGMRCSNNCYDQCGNGGCESCNSCSSCNSCDSCNSCGRSGHMTHSCGSCSDCGSDSCSSCSGSHGCSSCSGGCCDSGCGSGCNHGASDLFWPFNCSFLSSFSHCCSAPETFDCPGGGCGERYWCDWKSCPPTPDPCDHCGCYNGGCQCEKPCYQASPRFGSVPWPAWPPHDDSGVGDGDSYMGQKPKATTTQ
jgi:hypothetical protein